MDEVNRARATSHSYFSQRLRLHYLDWGNENAPHLLLIHGTQDHCHTWDWISQELCKNYHVVVPDLRGHGDSEWVKGSQYNLLDYVYDLAQLINQEDMSPVNIVAHSMGGTLACLLAGLYPDQVSSLVSMEGVGAVPQWYRSTDLDPQERLLEWIGSLRTLAARSPRNYSQLSDAFQRMQKSNPHLDSERAKHLTIHGSNRNEDGSYSWKFDNYTHSRSPYSIPFEDMALLWEKIDCPTLLLNAKQGFGHRTGQNDTLKHFRQGKLTDIDGAGHWIHHDQFDKVLLKLTEFLKEHAK